MSVNRGYTRARLRLIKAAGGRCESATCDVAGGRAIPAGSSVPPVTLPGGRRAMFCDECRERTAGRRVPREAWRDAQRRRA